MKPRICKNCGSEINGILTTTCPNCHNPLRLSVLQTIAAFLTSGITLTALIAILLAFSPANQSHQTLVQGAATKVTPTSVPSPTPTFTITPTPSPTPKPTHTPSKIPTATPTHTTYIAPTQATIQPTQPTTSQDSGLSNNNYYTNVNGNQVHSPANSNDGSVPAGATAQCEDGTFSFSQNHSGTCSHHGGVSKWL